MRRGIVCAAASRMHPTYHRRIPTDDLRTRRFPARSRTGRDARDAERGRERSGRENMVAAEAREARAVADEHAAARADAARRGRPERDDAERRRHRQRGADGRRARVVRAAVRRERRGMTEEKTGRRCGPSCGRSPSGAAVCRHAL
ncbi:Transcriptional regulator [Burkholderia dolosa AU0158]|nr:Transcriptional regulator [Burkholderia dolosa AU0158]